ncbi:unnamed protein product, partial [Polarella glacialis]
EASVEVWKAHTRLQRHVARFLAKPTPAIPGLLLRYQGEVNNNNNNNNSNNTNNDNDDNDDNNNTNNDNDNNSNNGELIGCATQRLLRLAVHVGAWVALLPAERVAAAISEQLSPAKLLAGMLHLLLAENVRITDWLEGVLHLVALRLDEVFRDPGLNKRVQWVELRQSMPQSTWRKLRNDVQLYQQLQQQQRQQQQQHQQQQQQQQPQQLYLLTASQQQQQQWNPQGS